MNLHADTETSGGVPCPPAPGELIAGKYRVESVLGFGGMGVVVSATHLELGQKVAIKILTLPDDDSRQGEARERFLREGRATAALVSDHVVRVHDVGMLPNGAPFMVMELLRGRDLALTLQRAGRLPIALACECIRQAAVAIACAHAQSIVHRDLKPSNLFLTERSDGSPLIKVLDFGISKAIGVSAERLTTALTLERSVLGTPFYMSPEQVRDAKKVDFRTDIWSLGLILHELLSGSPAFEGTTLPGICAAISADVPAALRLKRPEVPLELEAIVLQCLEKDPARRLQTARALSEQLAPWAGYGQSSHELSARAAPLNAQFAELRDSSTNSIAPSGGTPSADPGTLASAVFTKSGPRGPLGPDPVRSGHQAERTDESAAPIRKVGRYWFAIAGATFVLLGPAAWFLRAGQPRTPATAPSADKQLAPVAPPNASFSLQIVSTPAAADVYEGERWLGSTPMQLGIDPASVAQGPRRFVLRKPGYESYTLLQGPSSADRRVAATLEMRTLAPLAPATVPPNTAAAGEDAVRALAQRPVPLTLAAKKRPAAQASAQPVNSGGDIFMRR